MKSSILIAMAVYTYLRLIVDHHGTAQLQALRQKEVDFCISLLRERVREGRETQDEESLEVLCIWARDASLAMGAVQDRVGGRGNGCEIAPVPRNATHMLASWQGSWPASRTLL